jgi:hypothetical protein
MWGWVEDASDWVKEAAGGVWNLGKGILNFLWRGVWWAVNTLVCLY